MPEAREERAGEVTALAAGCWATAAAATAAAAAARLAGLVLEEREDQGDWPAREPAGAVPASLAEGCCDVWPGVLWGTAVVGCREGMLGSWWEARGSASGFWEVAVPNVEECWEDRVPVLLERDPERDILRLDGGAAWTQVQGNCGAAAHQAPLGRHGKERRAARSCAAKLGATLQGGGNTQSGVAGLCTCSMSQPARSQRYSAERQS